MRQVKVIAQEPELQIALSGELDSGNADAFFEVVMKVYQSAPKDIVFACGELAFLDSTTLGTFVKILKRLRENGHKLILEGLSPRLKKLFVICALDTIMEIR